MVNMKETDKWLMLATEEFNYAVGDLSDSSLSSFSQTCYHFQQAAEKYLKAFILANNLSFRKIHNLVELAKLCASTSPDFKNIIDEAALLNPYYTDTRYPVHWPMIFMREDADKAKNAAEKIKKLVEEKIKTS